MQGSIWPRLGAISGLLYVVLLFGAPGIPVGEDAHTVVEMAGLLLFIPFLGYLFSVLRRAEGEGGWLSATAFGAGLLSLTIKLGSAAPSLAARDLEEGPLHTALQTMNGVAFVLSMLPLGVLVAAVAILALKTRVLPLWLGLMSAVTAPALLVNGTFFEAEFVPAFLLFALWMVLTSVVLTLRAGRVDAEAASRRETAAENYRSPVREP
jgi:hypothetical protein